MLSPLSGGDAFGHSHSSGHPCTMLSASVLSQMMLSSALSACWISADLSELFMHKYRSTMTIVISCCKSFNA